MQATRDDYFCLSSTVFTVFFSPFLLSNLKCCDLFNICVLDRQVEHVLPFLRKGIGIHHSGLLPLLKETIEILFAEGLIKVCYSVVYIGFI